MGVLGVNYGCNLTFTSFPLFYFDLTTMEDEIDKKEIPAHDAVLVSLLLTFNIFHSLF